MQKQKKKEKTKPKNIVIISDHQEEENYNSKREDLEEKDQGKGERNVILKEKRRHNYKLNH